MLLSLETFRGILHNLTLLASFKINTFIYESNFVQNGGLVVDFFLFKWFCYFLQLCRKINTKKDVIDFQKKILRLYPRIY